MNIVIITRQWQCGDRRVTDVVNQYAFQVEKMKGEHNLLGVCHVVPYYNPVEIFARTLVSLPLSLLNGVLPGSVNKSCQDSDNYKFILYPYRNRIIYFENFELNQYFYHPDMVIIHWLDPGLIIAKKLHGILRVTLVIHELNVKIILNRLKLEYSDLKLVDRILVRNQSIQNELSKAGIRSKILRSGI